MLKGIIAIVTALIIPAFMAAPASAAGGHVHISHTKHISHKSISHKHISRTKHISHTTHISNKHISHKHISHKRISVRIPRH